MKREPGTLRQVITFLLITTLLSSVVFLWMFSGAKDSLPAVVLMMCTPGISAIFTALLYREKIGRFGWKPGKARYLALAYFLPLVVSLIAYGLVWLTGFAEFTSDRVCNYRWARMIGFELPAPFLAGFFSKMVLSSIPAILVITGEEIGWSGFLTPKLRERFSVPVTSVIVGGYWAIWHYPAIIGGFYGVGTPLWISLPGFTLVLIAASFIRTILVDKSGSLWTGVLVHTGHNVILMGIFKEMTVDQGFAYYFVSEQGLFLGVVYLVTAIIFWKISLRSEEASA